MSRKEFPAVLRQAEMELGDRSAFISVVRNALTPVARAFSRPIYEFLTKWPFACYLTTNFDNELQNYLNRTGQHYELVGNAVDDLAHLRDGVSHLIVKLHGDLEHPERAIITSQDYDRISTSPEWQPFRDKLRQALEVFDVVIIGHSITDPDLQLILSTAKHTANPRHPIFMFLANATDGDAREFLERFNIRLISYHDTDNSHRELKSLILLANRFIVAREAALPASSRINDDEILAASSLFIFRNLQTLVSEEPVQTLLGPLVLGALATAGKALTLDELLKCPAITPLAAAPKLRESLQECMDSLIASNHLKAEGITIALTKEGSVACKEASGKRKVEEQQAFGQFELVLRQKLPTITNTDCVRAKEVFRESLINSFRARGLALANVIITGQSLGADDLVDLFRSLTSQAQKLDRAELRMAFVEAAHAFLVEPNEPQRMYLASISQGFFLYHLAGKDPSCAKIRTDLFADTCWFLDSSLMLPLLARGCHNYQYACDFFSRLARAKAALFTTHRLLKETWYHLKWALEFVKSDGIDTPAFLMAAMARENYKQNLFIDGYIRCSAEGTLSTFRDYLQMVFPHGPTEQSIIEICRKHGVHALDASELKGFEMAHWGDIEDYKQKLVTQRKESGTFRGDFQVEAEAEALAIIHRLRSKDYTLPGMKQTPDRVYFVSQSRTLDRISADAGVITWSPEAVYRYAATLPGNGLNPDLLQQCMLHEYFYAGISFIDKPRYLKFFGPAINQAKLDYREQVGKYLADTEQQAFRHEYDEAFAQTPDLEKPFFVSQMGWQLARAAEQKAEQVVHSAESRIAKADEDREFAENRARKAEEDAESTRKKLATVQQEASHQRNLRDIKHVRKRERQAKERARKKLK
jgi:hypothetical protein